MRLLYMRLLFNMRLNFDNINNHSEKISKIRPFIDQYNWKDIDFLPTNKDWKKI